MIWDKALQESEPRINMSVELFRKAGGGYIEAQNAAGLAAKIGVPVGVLLETIKAFNKAVKNDGTAPDAFLPMQAAVDDQFIDSRRP